jgi:hypothetical protein
VLRALSEAGVRLDLVAGRGIGAVAALFAAVDAGQRLWEPDGLWLGRPGPPRLYRWRLLWRVLGYGLAAVAIGALVPFAVLAGVAVLAPFAVLLDILAPARGEAVVRTLAAVASLTLYDGIGALLVSRIVVIAAMVVAVALAASWVRERSRGRRRRPRGPVWWEALGAPLDATPVVRWVLDGFWRFVHGATKLPRPDDRDLSRRYAELLADNFTQPGYRELIIAAHDLETRRDLVFALLGPDHRGRFFGDDAASQRSAEVVDLAAPDTIPVADALAAALAVPLLTEPHLVSFPATSFWRGETHRVCDRPAAIVRLLEEVSAAGVEQVIVVTSDVALDRPHSLRARLVDPRARLADFLAGAEASAARDALTALFDRFSGVFQIQPIHNAVGLFDPAGSYDERSDRRQSIRELVELGYEDASSQFIEPVVGASGDELERQSARPPVAAPTPEPPSIAEMLAKLDR